MTSLKIRDAVLSDRQAISTMCMAAYQEYEAAMPGLCGGIGQWTLGDVSPAEQIVAEQDGRIVGGVLLYPMGAVFFNAGVASPPLEWPTIRLLAVHPESRGQGIGKALIHECIRRARQAGAEFITLHTREMMKAAMRLYEQMGFARAPELDLHPAAESMLKGYRFGLIK